jgi:hypothetical protein
LFASLAVDADDAQGLVDVGERDASELGRPQPAGVDEFEQGSIPEPERQTCVVVFVVRVRRGVGRLDEPADLGRGEHVREPAPARGLFEPVGRVRRDPPLAVQEAEEHLDRRQVARDRTRRHAPAGLEAGEVLRELTRLHLGEVRRPGALQVLEEIAQVAGVRLQSVRAESALDAHEREE